MKRLLLVRRSLGKGGILFTVLSLAALGVLIWLLLPARDSEPSYQGKPLSEWLASYLSPDDNGSLAQAGEAVRHIGTNSIPTLLEMLEETDSPLRLKWIALLEKQHIFRPPLRAFFRNHEAVCAFQALGPNASNAVPALVRIYRENQSYYSQTYLLTTLGHIGPAALPAATPVFLDGLTNSDVRLRMEAVLLIGGIHGQPDVFVPALINALKDVNPRIRPFAAQSLGRYGPEARSAVPALVTSLNDNYSVVRSYAAAALKKIDPAAAANAGIK